MANVLLIVADDLGLMLGCYGLQAIQTPNVDRLAAQGARFTNAFASTASCSGSRSTLYTGLHTHQNGQYGLQQGWCHFQTLENVETTPLLFNALGYQTGIIGKVHVGPREVYPWTWNRPSLSRDVRQNAAEAGRFFDAAMAAGQPFHLTVGLRDPHRDETRGGFGNDEPDVRDIAVPDYRPEDVEIPPFLTDVPELRAELVEYYKSISRMDTGVGLLLDELERRGLADSTLVLFISDNGAPFVNSKTTLYDAGVRLPLIVRKPNTPPASTGIVNPNMVSWVDVLPTCLAWAGVPPTRPDGPESPSSYVVQTSLTAQAPRRIGASFLDIVHCDTMLPLERWQQHVFGSHTFHEVQNYWPTRFLRDHRYKYHRNIAWRLDFPFATDIYSSLSWEGLRNASSSATATTDTPELMIGRRRLQHYIFRGPEELFDLDADPEEVTNLAGRPEHAERLVAMRATLEQWQLQTDDVWLFRDGVSAITTYGAQKQGLQLPDRFDFDPSNPANAVGPHWVRPQQTRAPRPATTEFA